MKIENLPIKIKKAALANQVAQGYAKNENQYLQGAFIWGLSKEPHDFWQHVDRGKFEKAYEICPHLRPDAVIAELRGELLGFLFYLNEGGLINNHDFDYQFQVDKYIKNKGK